MNTNFEDILITNYAKVIYDRNLKLGKIDWVGKASTEEYKFALESLLEAQRKNPIHYYLSDLTKQSVVSPESRKWFETVALPLAIKQGVTRAAVIMDGNAFKKYYVNVILKTTNKYNLPIKVFSEEQEAIEWLTK